MSVGSELDDARSVISRAATEAGRDPSVIGMEAQLDWNIGAVELVKLTDLWRTAGASHVAINTMESGLVGVDAHLKALALVAEALQLPPGGLRSAHLGV
jgi:hypothetical protein